MINVAGLHMEALVRKIVIVQVLVVILVVLLLLVGMGHQLPIRVIIMVHNSVLMIVAIRSIGIVIVIFVLHPLV